MSVAGSLKLGIGRKLPMQLQTEAAECGMACLAMVSSYFGSPFSLTDLRSRYGFSLKGASLEDMVRVSDQIGLATRPLRLELDELRLLKLPCVLHWNLNHFVVLKSVSKTGIVIHDPDVGVRKLSMNETARHFTGVAVEFTATGGFQNVEPEPRVKLTAMLGTFSGIGRALLQLLGLAFAIEIFAIISPLFMQWVVDHALVSADWDLLSTLVVGFFLLLLIRVGVSAMRSWTVMVLGASLNVQARSNLFKHLLSLPVPFFESRHLGDVISRFTSQESILEAITTELIEVVLDGLMVTITLAIMFIYAPPLAILVACFAAAYALIRWISFARFRQAAAEEIIWGAKSDTHFLETLRGITTVKLFNAQEERRSHWVNLVVETINRQLTGDKLYLLVSSLNALLVGTLTILVVWLGATRVLENTFSVGMLLAFISYKDQFMSRVSALVDRIVELKMLKLHGERLADIALTEPEPESQTQLAVASAGMAPKPVSVELRNVFFRYAENEPWILEDISFKINAGESVAISGVSGCGKTTLLKLMAGLLTPAKGEIIVDGEPLRRIGMHQYRTMIGVVMQDDQLFSGSISDNISFFSKQVDQKRVEYSAIFAAVHEDIMAMPMAYHTLIGDMGTVLSGGQKQRVLVARALYRKPSLLLLDEATSHLDIKREKQLNAAIKVMNITRVLVAHRPETISSADRVIQLEKGKIIKHLSIHEDTDLRQLGLAEKKPG
ncbi:MAG: peptidase domain-containing ABC transporter [Granulosicoccus sp.]